jgi:hypothetical protein
MNFAISWILGLFKKPQVEVTFDKAQIKAWPFPVESKKPKKQVKKTRPLPSKATVAKAAAKKSIAAKKATKVVKKAK